jgi:hypothetical protein
MYQLRKINLNMTSRQKAEMRINGKDPMEGDVWSTHKSFTEAMAFKKLYMGQKGYLFRIRLVEDN